MRGRDDSRRHFVTSAGIIVGSALARPAWLMLLLVGIQVMLGALVVWTGLQPIVNTAHLVNGALLLATSVVLTFARAGRSWQWALAPSRPAVRCNHHGSKHTREDERCSTSGGPDQDVRLRDARQAAPERPGRRISAGWLRHGGRRHVGRRPRYAPPCSGTGLVASGASAFNQLLERDSDCTDATHAAATAAGRTSPAVGGARLRGCTLCAWLRRAGARRKSAERSGSARRRWPATPWSTRRSSGERRSQRSSGQFPERCPRSSVGLPDAATCRRARGFSLPSSSCGNCRTSWRSRGSIERITRARDCGCCQSSNRTAGARPAGNRLLGGAASRCDGADAARHDGQRSISPALSC